VRYGEALDRAATLVEEGRPACAAVYEACRSMGLGHVWSDVLDEVDAAVRPMLGDRRRPGWRPLGEWEADHASAGEVAVLLRTLAVA
jgi:hypothetical protein